jgi:hypothetical protein
MGILSGNQKDEPMHYGEIYDVWQVSTKAKGAISVYRAYQYHAGDKDLKKILSKLIDQAELEVSECDTILTQNGITPSPSLPERPEVKIDDIPMGARFTDQEIAAKIAADTSLGMVGSSVTMGKSVREDINALFMKYHAANAALWLRILRISKEKGWLIPPPLQIERPELVNS